MTEKEFHLKQAKQCFNTTWDYIEKETRSKEDDLMMIHLAHTSRYHWSIVGEAIHFERGEWLISKVYHLLGKAESAMYHAQACLDICKEHNILDFDIAFAYEAMAKSHNLLNHKDEYESFKKMAFDALDGIKEKGDYDYTLSELKKI